MLFTEQGVTYDDGSSEEADVVVFATGFKNMREDVRAIFGDSVADRCVPVYRLDVERNELASVWSDSCHPGLWFVAGSLSHCRMYSKYLAIRLKAIEEGLLEHAVAAAGM